MEEPDILQKIVSELSELYTKTEVAAWLRTPHAAFAGATPQAVVIRGEGHLVLAYVHRLTDGTP